MKLFLDCEFTNFKGELISIGLVDEDGQEFYEVLEYPEPCEWVKENVVPILYLEPRPRIFVQKRLQDFLMQYTEIEVIADWPEDISFFCNLLITGASVRINTPPLTMRVIREIDSSSSSVPHNALEDAQAIKRAYYKLNKSEE